MRSLLFSSIILAFSLTACSGLDTYNPGDPRSEEFFVTYLLRCALADNEVCPAPPVDPGSLFARVQASTNQSVPDSTNTTIAMDTLVQDTGTFFSGGASDTATIPWTGNYISILGASFASNNTGYRQFGLSRNGSAVRVMNRLTVTGGGAVTAATPMHIGSFTEGDTLSIGAFQNSGGNLDLVGGDFSAFQIARLAGAISGAAGVTITVPFSVTNGVPTILNWANEEFDTGGYFDAGNPTRLTAAQDGTYLILSRMEIVTGLGMREAEVLLNGSTLIAHGHFRPDFGAATPVYVSAIRTLSAGDYLELRVTHNNIGALNLSSADFQLIRLDTNDTTFADRPLVVREMSADVTILDNTDTIIDLDNTISADTIFDVSNTLRTTVNAAGLYLVMMTGGYTGAANFRRRIRLLRNGATAYEALVHPDTGFDSTVDLVIAIQLNVGDYLEYQTFQNTGAALNLLQANTRFTLMKLD